MGKPLPRVVLAARTQRERKRRRAGIRLRDFAISAKTKARYELAVGRILPVLEALPDLSDLDQVLSEFVEAQWARGESLYVIADGLSGLHFFWPELRGTLRNSWRLFKCWRRVEAPARAPPITGPIVRAFIARAVELNELSFACLLALGFHALLRTGELLNVAAKDLDISEACGVLRLPHSKSGARTGSNEAIAIRDKLTLQLLDTWLAVVKPAPGQLLWPYSAQRFRRRFLEFNRFFRICDLQFKPYSLRRGGATFLLQWGQPMEAILLRGRWRSLAVARLYLQDGLSLIPTLKIPAHLQEKLARYTADTPSTAFKP